MIIKKEEGRYGLYGEFKLCGTSGFTICLCHKISSYHPDLLFKQRCAASVNPTYTECNTNP